MLDCDLTVTTLCKHYAEVRKRLMGVPEAKEIAVQQPPEPEPEPEPAEPEPIRPALPPRVMRTEHPPIDLIMDEVTWFYQVTKMEVISQRRQRAVVIPRHVAMYLCKNMTLRSFPEIGRRFGGRDHTTVMHALRSIEDKMQCDGDLAQEVATIRSRIEKRHAALNEAAA